MFLNRVDHRHCRIDTMGQRSVGVEIGNHTGAPLLRSRGAEVTRLAPFVARADRVHIVGIRSQTVESSLALGESNLLINGLTLRRFRRNAVVCGAEVRRGLDHAGTLPIDVAHTGVAHRGCVGEGIDAPTDIDAVAGILIGTSHDRKWTCGQLCRKSADGE